MGITPTSGTVPGPIGRPGYAWRIQARSALLLVEDARSVLRRRLQKLGQPY